MEPHPKPNHDNSGIGGSNWLVPYWDEGIVIGKKYPSNELQKTICLYFQDIQEISYQTISQQELRSQVIQNLVRKTIRQKLKRTNLSNQKFYLKPLGKTQLITLNSQLFYKQCERVVVQFQRPLLQQINEYTTFLWISTNIHLDFKISLQNHQKFRLRQLFIKQKLGKYLFNSLLVNGTIINSYQTLQKIKLSPGIHPAFPLFPFQIFHHYMQQVYQTLKQRNFSFQTLINQYGNANQMRKIEEKYKLLSSLRINKSTSFTILYLMSQFFNQLNQKKIINDFINGKIQQIQDHPQMQKISLMLNCITSLPSADAQPIYIIEKFEQQHQREHIETGHIVRVQTFCRATKNYERMNQKLKNGNYQTYKVEHLTAKNVSLYNGDQFGFTHLILPFTQYYVEIINRRNSIIEYTLIEIPTPKRLDSNLIIYISKSPSEAQKIQQCKPLNCQLVQIKSNKLLQIYYKKYYCLINSRKYCIIYNNYDQQDAVKAVTLTRQNLGPEVNILVCTEDPAIIENKLKENKENLDRIKTTNSQRTFNSFIHSCLQDKKFEEQRDSCQCVIS